MANALDLLQDADKYREVMGIQMISCKEYNVRAWEPKDARQLERWSQAFDQLRDFKMFYRPLRVLALVGLFYLVWQRVEFSEWTWNLTLKSQVESNSWFNSTRITLVLSRAHEILSQRPAEALMKSMTWLWLHLPVSEKQSPLRIFYPVRLTCKLAKQWKTLNILTQHVARKVVEDQQVVKKGHMFLTAMRGLGWKNHLKATTRASSSGAMDDENPGSTVFRAGGSSLTSFLCGSSSRRIIWWDLLSYEFAIWIHDTSG